MATIWMGNVAAREGYRIPADPASADPAHVAALRAGRAEGLPDDDIWVKKERIRSHKGICYFSVPDDVDGAVLAQHVASRPNGLWPRQSAAAPAWVASDSPRLEQLLAGLFGVPAGLPEDAEWRAVAKEHARIGLHDHAARVAAAAVAAASPAVAGG